MTNRYWIFLRPVKIVNWFEDGLFTKTGEYSVRRKIKFVIAIRSAAFDYAPRELCEVKGSSRVSKVEIIADKMMRARRVFDAAKDEKMREIMKFMILSENLLSAHWGADKFGYKWSQFKVDFNYALDEVIKNYDRMRGGQSEQMESRISFATNRSVGVIQIPRYKRLGLFGQVLGRGDKFHDRIACAMAIHRRIRRRRVAMKTAKQVREQIANLERMNKFSRSNDIYRVIAVLRWVLEEDDA